MLDEGARVVTEGVLRYQISEGIVSYIITQVASGTVVDSDEVTIQEAALKEGQG